MDFFVQRPPWFVVGVAIALTQLAMRVSS